MKDVLFHGRFADIGIPGRVHIPARDGGHLIIRPHEHVVSTSELSFEKGAELHTLRAIAREIMSDVFNVTFFNEQENGNWSVKKPREQQHAHIHIYGRAQNSLTQTFGEAIAFPHTSELQNFGWQYDEDTIQRLQNAAEDIKQDDWVRDEYRKLDLLQSAIARRTGAKPGQLF